MRRFRHPFRRSRHCDWTGCKRSCKRRTRRWADLTVLPDLDLFIYAYVRKEAVLSSQIEGMQSSLSDLMLFESNEAPRCAVQDRDLA
ncbi:Fic/DOC family N-terminal domain-containing protein [uncultured Paludibaculum sp.]|uniref:Fic/DOC family N-terminal domain-containing protein n=1 Tax=uncultured Paludibaculum sp. TaxID=1765020 RepID=UPI00374CE3DE